MNTPATLEEVKERLKIEMNSTPDNYEESAVKIFAHEIYELITGETLSEEIKRIVFFD